MGSKRSRRFGFAAWLGLFAIAVQAFVPALVAAELALAHHEGAGRAFELCIFGHVHPAPADRPSVPPADDEKPGTVCPICIALLASPPFTAPPLIALPLPTSARSEAPALVSEVSARFEVATAYQSRAPPRA
jgi:Protein of unknown function (DUF2946)